ncbi:MAG: hypothetical protein ACI88L_000101, partial [Candidatus Paceibacteria bacterium]
EVSYFKKVKMEINISKNGSYLVYAGDEKSGVDFVLSECKKIKAPHSGADCLVFQKTTISIDDIRLIQDMHEQKSIGEEKTIICAGSFITTQAQNALLKMIEDTKKGERIFLIVAYEAELLPTIISRVQTFRLQTGVESGEAKDFVEMPAHARISYIEKNFLSIEESDSKRDALLGFFRDLEKYTHSQQNLTKYEDLLRALPVLRTMLGNPGAPAKMIAEYVALAF